MHVLTFIPVYIQWTNNWYLTTSYIILSVHFCQRKSIKTVAIKMSLIIMKSSYWCAWDGNNKNIRWHLFWRIYKMMDASRTISKHPTKSCTMIRMFSATVPWLVHHFQVYLYLSSVEFNLLRWCMSLCTKWERQEYKLVNLSRGVITNSPVEKNTVYRFELACSHVRPNHYATWTTG